MSESNKDSKPKRLKWALRTVGLLLLIIIVLRVGREALLSELKNANWSLVVVSAVLCGLHFVAKAIRWNCILKKADVKVGHWVAIKAYCSAALVGLVTPGRLGELSKAAFVKGWDENASWGKALGTVVLDRIIDVAAFAFVASLGIVLVGLPGDYHIAGELLAVVLLAGGFLGSLFAWRWLVKTSYWDKLRDFAYAKIGVGISDFYQVMKQVRPREVLPIAFWTLVAYGLFFLHFALLGKALGSALSIKVLSWGIAIASLAAILPISISGIGVRDFVLLAVFQTWGEEPARVLAISLTYLGILYVVIASMGVWPFLKGDMDLKMAMKRKPDNPSGSED